MIFFQFIISFQNVLTLILENPTIPENIKLDILRKRIKEEISTLNEYTDEITGKSLILDNWCGMVNTDGVCYFNSVIQSLFSSRNFLLFYLMNDFTKEKLLSLLIQEMAYAMLMQKKIDPVPYINKFSHHPRLANHCSIDGGNPKVLLEELLIGLYEEIANTEYLKYLEGSPKNFFYVEKFFTKCKKCKKYSTDTINSPSLNVPFSNSIEESVKFYYNIKNVENMNRYYKCEFCDNFTSVFEDDFLYEAVPPRNLIIVFERVKIKNNFIYCIFQETNLNKNIEIDGCKYTLYAAICSHLLSKGYHANAIVKRDGRWIIFNDNQLEIYPYNYEDKNILNNYAWILFYRKLNN